MKKAKVTIKIEYEGKVIDHSFTVKNDKDLKDLYYLCHHSDWSWNIEADIARLFGAERPEL